jgi:molybdopterin-containing oxidoreductase family iron-sulfur binding subunit
MLSIVSSLRETGGEGFRILLGPSTSPSLQAQLTALNHVLPKLIVHSYAAVDRTDLYAGAARAFGKPLEQHWSFANARVLVSLEGDILDAGPHQVGASRQWSAARRKLAGAGELLGLHAVSCIPSLTSARADFAYTAAPDLIEAMARSLLAQANGSDGPELGAEAAQWCKRASQALAAARGHGIVNAGIHAGTSLQEAALRINAAYGNAGSTVLFTDPVPIRGESLAALTHAMAAGAVQTLFMIGCNPVYDAPADLDFAKALDHVAIKIHAGLYEDETALHADWHLPLCHPLESWDDARSIDGTPSLIQPTIAPLYDGKTTQEILSLLFDAPPATALLLLRAYWQSGQKAEEFEPAWRQALLDGIFASQSMALHTVQPIGSTQVPAATTQTSGLSIAFRPDPSVWDGTVSNNAWLQELPKPFSKIVWENAIGISPSLAQSLGLATGDIIEVKAQGRQIEGPVWITHGQADNVIGVTLGYGHIVTNQLSDGLGYNASHLRINTNPWLLANASIRKTGGHHSLATTEEHNAMQGSGFVRVQTPGDTQTQHAPIQPTLYPAQEGDGRAWGMVIDLDSCIGCNACVVACQAENNIAVVGREQVMLGRELHWLRIDRTEADGSGAKSHFMPVPCMHCEQAPCEVGCPVEATLHDHEGLNLMVYNRCVGTRACSGYCPYKVRRFNYFDYAANTPREATEQFNPDVTVRARGVMEKCTFCVQRIAHARIESDRDNTPIPDGAVQTACQGACPTSAIVFGDLADASSKVNKAHADPRRYALLEELNTRPRTTYLAKLGPAAGEG